MHWMHLQYLENSTAPSPCRTVLKVVMCLGTMTDHPRSQILSDFGSLGQRGKEKCHVEETENIYYTDTKVLIQCPREHLLLLEVFKDMA